MKRRYSLVEALINEGAFEDRIQQARAKAESLLSADPAEIPARDRNEYARSNAVIQFLEMVQSPNFPAASKNIGYLSWGISRIKECADAEINTIAEEVEILIRAHTELKGTRQVSPTIDDYTTLGALRSAVEEAALSRQTKLSDAEGRKAGKEMLDAAIRMSDILFLDGSIVTDEEGLRSFSPETNLIVIAPKTRTASQVLGNSRTFGINTLGGPVRWCTSATTYGNQYCNYTVNSNVFLIYVIDLTKQDKDLNQKIAFVFTPSAVGSVATGTSSSDINVDGKQFMFQTFNNQDSSGPTVTQSAMNSLGSSTFNRFMDLMQEYISAQGGVPHLSKKAGELAAGSSDIDFIRGVASEELPAGYGVEALYDTIQAKDSGYGRNKDLVIPPAMKDLLTRDNIDSRSARRIVKMFAETGVTSAASHFYTNVEDAKSVAEATLFTASNADSPRDVKSCLSLIEIIASRQDIDDEARRIVEDAKGKVDLLMAQAIGRLEVIQMLNYKDEINKSRYPMAIVNTLVPSAVNFLKDPANVKQSNLQNILTIVDLIVKSPGAAGSRQLPLKMIPLTSSIMQNVTKQIALLIRKNNFGGAKKLSDFITKTGIAGRPELQKLAPALAQVIDVANDRHSRNNIILSSSDEQEVIELINDPTMTRYLDIFSNPSLTDGMMQAAYDRAVSEGDSAIGDMLTTMIASPGFLEGESEVMRIAKDLIGRLDPRDTAVLAALSVMEAFGVVMESRRFRRPVVKETSRKRYSLTRSLLGY